MVFQKPNPFPKSIFENIAYGPKIHGLADSRVDLDEIVEGSLKKSGDYGRRSKSDFISQEQVFPVVSSSDFVLQELLQLAPR